MRNLTLKEYFRIAIRMCVRQVNKILIIKECISLRYRVYAKKGSVVHQQWIEERF